jgi:hypothetical protein
MSRSKLSQPVAPRLAAAQRRHGLGTPSAYYKQELSHADPQADRAAGCARPQMWRHPPESRCGTSLCHRNIRPASSPLGPSICVSYLPSTSWPPQQGLSYCHAKRADILEHLRNFVAFICLMLDGGPRVKSCVCSDTRWDSAARFLNAAALTLRGTTLTLPGERNIIIGRKG